jgi:subtilisin family serine protease
MKSNNSNMVEAARNGAGRCSIAKLRKRLFAVALLFAASAFTAQTGLSQVIPGDYIVLLKPGNQPADVASAHGLERRHTYSSAVNGFAGSIPDGRLQALQNDPRVESIEPDQTVFPFAQTTPTGVSRIGATRSATAKIDGIDERVNVDVAIIDSGIDLSHPDLNVVGHVSVIPDGSGGNDGYGHGTAVAGIVGALDNDFGVVGVAPGARLWAVKVIDNSGAGSLSALISGVDYVTQNASTISVANISLGFVGTSSALRTAIQNGVARGVVFVAAAGNSWRDVYGADGVFGTSDDTIPAAYPEVITVSSMNDNDGQPGGLGYVGWDDTLAYYSNFGQKIDLAGVGTTYTTALVSKGSYGNQYEGTSLAGAHVSGAAALYVAANGRATSSTGVQAIKQGLVAAGEPQSAWCSTGTVDPDSYHEPLVNAAGGSSPPPPPPVNNRPTVLISSPVSGSTFSSGASISFSGSANDVEQGNLSGNLTWTSSIDGQIGTGSSFSKVLSSGNHTVTASVTDAGGLTGSASVTFTVQGAPPPPPTAQLDVVVATDKPSYVNKNTVRILVSVTDGVNNISGATVSAQVTSAKGAVKSYSGTTGANGVATFSYAVNSKSTGTGTYSVNASASKSGYVSASDSTTFLVQ